MSGTDPHPHVVDFAAKLAKHRQTQEAKFAAARALAEEKWLATHPQPVSEDAPSGS